MKKFIYGYEVQKWKNDELMAMNDYKVTALKGIL